MSYNLSDFDAIRIPDEPEAPKQAGPLPATLSEGGRNHALASVAGSMRRRGATQQGIEAALLAENSARCSPPLSENEVRKIAESVARYAPAKTLGPKISPGPQSEPNRPVPDAFKLEPADLADLLSKPLPECKWLLPDYVPEQRRIMVVGPTESAKSMWAEWLACKLSREGRLVVYISQENPLDEDVRRLKLLRPDPDLFRFIHAQELDLADPTHVAAVIEVSQGAALVIFDTLSACWTGDESDNREIVALDKNAIQPILRDTGSSTMVLDHSGHAQAFVKRRGPAAARGASSKGQKTDVFLEFRPVTDRQFSIYVGKMRAGDGHKVSERVFSIVDIEDGIDIESAGDVQDLTIERLADDMAEAIGAVDFLTTKQLRQAVKAGAENQTAAMRKLEEEGRAVSGWETVDTGGGPQRAKVWRPIS